MNGENQNSNMGAKIIEIIEFTDPVCTWCWGSEPVLRTLEYRFGNKLKVSFVMGGLVKDITDFYDDFNNIGGDPETSNKSIASHWLEASKRHGMPVKTEGFKLFTKEHPSSYPQNIAYKAAQMQDEILAVKFLRRIREASAAEAKQTNLTEVLIELASETGLDTVRFTEDFTGGKANAAFEEDLYTTSQFGVTVFPTFIIKYGEKSVKLKGFIHYIDFKTIINQLSNGEVQEVKVLPTKQNILEFIKSYDTVAPAEVKMAFDLSDTEFENIANSLLKENLIRKKEVGNGYLISHI